jgi:hypothetical protein
MNKRKEILRLINRNTKKTKSGKISWKETAHSLASKILKQEDSHNLRIKEIEERNHKDSTEYFINIVKSNSGDLYDFLCYLNLNKEEYLEFCQQILDGIIDTSFRISNTELGGLLEWGGNLNIKGFSKPFEEIDKDDFNHTIFQYIKNILESERDSIYFSHLMLEYFESNDYFKRAIENKGELKCE